MIKTTKFILALTGLVLGLQVSVADARATYATWVHHGDAYTATGKLGGETQTFNVKIIRKGTRYIVRTPLGDYSLTPQGSAVVFKIRIKKSWAKVIWTRARATIRYKNKTGNVSLRRRGR